MTMIEAALVFLRKRIAGRLCLLKASAYEHVEELALQPALS